MLSIKNKEVKIVLETYVNIPGDLKNISDSAIDLHTLHLICYSLCSIVDMLPRFYFFNYRLEKNIFSKFNELFQCVDMIATARMLRPRSSVFRADHPFIIELLHGQKFSRNILFSGRITRPYSCTRCNH